MREPGSVLRTLDNGNLTRAIIDARMWFLKGHFVILAPSFYGISLRPIDIHEKSLFANFQFIRTLNLRVTRKYVYYRVPYRLLRCNFWMSTFGKYKLDDIFVNRPNLQESLYTETLCT